MALRVSRTRADGGSEGDVEYDTNPDKCPRCNHNVTPAALSNARHCSDTDRFEIPFHCPNQECGRVFIGTYVRNPEGGFKLSHTAPSSFKRIEFSDEITATSTQFVEIFNQAIRAESLGLSEIAGVGFRKALEFLIKDYVIAMGADEETVKKAFLGICINEHVDDERLKQTAARAAWLGNDETHYTRRWADKDIADLKILIKLTVNWIESSLLSAQYEKDMPAAGK